MRIALIGDSDCLKATRSHHIPVTVSPQCGICAVRDGLKCPQQQGKKRS